MFDWNGDRKQLLSILWTFLTVNYLYCDIFTLNYAPALQRLLTGVAGGIEITEGFLLMFAFVMQIPMIMIVLSRYLRFTQNRYLNIAAAVITGSIQSFTVYMGGTYHYLFFSFFEIGTALLILVVAIRWRRDKAA